LSILTKDIEDFHPDLRNILVSNKGIRKWEYGMMAYGLPSVEGKEVLDIGSGPSLLPIYLAKRLKARVTVLDLYEPYTINLETLMRRLSRAGVTFKAGDMRNMPFPDQSFDIVLSISVIEHLSHSADHNVFLSREDFIRETRNTLREMYRILRPGGWIYVTSEAYVPGRVDYDNWAGKLLNGDPYGAYPLHQVNDIFVSTLRKLGASFPYPICLDESLLLGSPQYASYRNRFITAFNLFVQKAAA
jgi:SAM-dependent methyltransferase